MSDEMPVRITRVAVQEALKALGLGSLDVETVLIDYHSVVVTYIPKSGPFRSSAEYPIAEPPPGPPAPPDLRGIHEPKG